MVPLFSTGSLALRQSYYWPTTSELTLKDVGKTQPYQASINSMAPGKFEWKFEYVIFEWIFVIDDWGFSCEITLVWMSLGLHWWSVNIGSGNGLVPSGNKPLPEPMLTQISVAIWHH